MSSLKTTNILHPSSASNNIVLDSSGNIAVQAGTAGAPAIQANGDSNTGIYFPAADNIGFTTGGTIRGRWTTDGLCFNADTAAGNALDDYEEGTWTPASSFSGGNGTRSDTVAASYTKIGDVVYAWFDIAITKGTASGNLSITGLPFTSSGDQAKRAGVYFVYVSLASLTNGVFAYIGNSSTTMTVFNGPALTNVSATNLNATSQLIGTAIYKV